MESTENQFLVTVQNTPENIKNFLIDHGIEGKSTAPILFFSEEDREKFLRHSD